MLIEEDTVQNNCRRVLSDGNQVQLNHPVQLNYPVYQELMWLIGIYYKLKSSFQSYFPIFNFYQP